VVYQTAPTSTPGVDRIVRLDGATFAVGATADAGVRYVFDNGLAIYGGFRVQFIDGHQQYLAWARSSICPCALASAQVSEATLARCMRSGGDSCFKTWRGCVADKGCAGAYGLEPEADTADTSAPQALPRSSVPPSARKPPPRRPTKVPPSAPVF
jgi:hypothetical protein